MKLIALSKTGKHKGKFFAMVDDEDYEWLNQFSWNASINNTGNIYVERTIYNKMNGIKCKMHRLILGLIDPKIKCDHIDHNGLNNQRSNLRSCTQQQNCMNTSKRENLTSIYLGVHLYTDRKKMKNGEIKEYKSYHSKITDPRSRKRMPLGYFKTEEEAAKRYDSAAKFYYGEFANLNFK